MDSGAIERGREQELLRVGLVIRERYLEIEELWATWERINGAMRGEA